MNKKLFFSLVVAVIVTQIYHSNSQGLSENCKGKLMDQMMNPNMSEYVNCFNISSLDKIKDNAQILSQLFTSLPDGCKNPFSSNIKTCLKVWLSTFKNHSSEVQASIAGSINTVFAASKDCISQASQQLSYLSNFIANDCK